MHILIFRDPREPAAKCSLTPLRGMDEIDFVAYEKEVRVNVEGRILLSTDGALLTPADQGLDLFLIDSSWRRLPQLARNVDGTTLARRLPDIKTAYPRKSRVYDDPGNGLASVEALYGASLILGQPRPELLDEYYWRDEFLRLNAELFSRYS